MTEYIKAKITGIFPKEDIALIANFYGGEHQEDKLEHVLKIAQASLADFLSAPSRSQIVTAKQAEQQVELNSLVERVSNSLSAEAEEITQ